MFAIEIIENCQVCIRNLLRKSKAPFKICDCCSKAIDKEKVQK